MRIGKPRGLLGRSVLIVVLPVLLLQSLAAYTILLRHYDRVSRQLTEEVVRELRVATREVNAAGTRAEADAVLPLLSRVYGARFTFPAAEAVTAETPEIWDMSGRIAVRYLYQYLGPGILASLPTGGKHVTLVLPTRYGPLAARIPRNRVAAVNPYLLLTWTTGASLLLVGIAFLYLRNQVRPIRSLAAAMRAFGQGRILPPRPGGAREVREARAAFLSMRTRIERHIEQRALLPLALSHDLRTPLTRMRLAVELEADRETLVEALDEMDGVVEDFLEFARDEWSEGGSREDVAALLRQVVAGMPEHAIELVVDLAPERATARLRAGALRRCLANLVQNAVRHGQRVRVSARRTRRWLLLVVEDDGPGIPAARRAEAVMPFRRLGEGRDRLPAGGGMGLGLAIAREVARLHGGDLHFGHSRALGGLRASVVIPVAAPGESDGGDSDAGDSDGAGEAGGGEPGG